MLTTIALIGLTAAVDLRVYPDAVELSGAHARQQLLALDAAGPFAVADRTESAKFQSSDEAVAAVTGAGVVVPRGDGAATLTATVDGRTATVRVRVTAFRADAGHDFRNHVIPVLTRSGCNSGACHGALAGKGGLKLSLRGYDPDSDFFVITRQALGRRVEVAHPADSLILQKAVRAIPHGGGKKFDTDSEEYRRLRDWIAAGAADSPADGPTVTRLDVFPPALRLKSGDTARVVVRAHYSDGRSADVTDWAKFSSSDDSVATIDEAGRLTIAGAGEAALNVAYANAVASATVAVPRAGAIDTTAFTASPRHNFIDELVLRKLEALNVPPSPLCDDATFLRRAFLDAAGRLPTPGELDEFLADAAPGKRGRWVERILATPEYVDYWSYKWGDLLLVSSKKLPQPAMWAFHHFVRDAVADNVPWDRFARELLTASGSSLHNGAVNYFVMHKDAAELTEKTAVTFLGLSVACAKCHNHPLEKWTQDQYWAFANLFGRVGYKNGDRRDEVFVYDKAEGDVAHPRRGVAMAPAPLDAAAVGNDANRRAHLARWVTSPDNPFFARAAVNRVWKVLMGRGLVEAEDDLRQTNPPSNAELFDAVTADFVKNGYDVKRLVRVILNSAAYQRSAAPVAGNEADEKYYSRYILRRLPAEVILDAYAQVTGVPTPFDKIQTGGGGANVSRIDTYPVGTRAQQLPDTRVISRFLDSFGRPERLAACACERQSDASVSQSLHLNNGWTLNDKLRAAESTLNQWASAKYSDDEVIIRLFRAALTRGPTPAELTKFKAALAGVADRREAVEDVAWAVLTSREFLFNH